MPMTELLAEDILNQLFRGVSYSFPTTLYAGLGVAPVWTAGTRAEGEPLSGGERVRRAQDGG